MEGIHHQTIIHYLKTQIHTIRYIPRYATFYEYGLLKLVPKHRYLIVHGYLERLNDSGPKV